MVPLDGPQTAPPNGVERVVIVCGIRCKRVFGKAISGGRIAMIVAVPVRNPKPGDVEIRKMRPHILRNPAEILGDDFRTLGGIENRPQADISIRAVGCLVFDAVVGSEKPAWQTPPVSAAA